MGTASRSFSQLRTHPVERILNDQLGTFDLSGKPTTGDSGITPTQESGDAGGHKGPFGGVFDKDGKPVTGGAGGHKGPFGGLFDKDGKPASGDAGTSPTQETGESGVHTGPFGTPFDKDGKPVDSGSSTTGGKGSSGGVPVNPSGDTGVKPGSGPQPPISPPIKEPHGGVIQPDTGTSGGVPGLAHPLGSGKWVYVPQAFSEQCVQSVFDALKCTSCAQC